MGKKKGKAAVEEEVEEEPVVEEVTDPAPPPPPLSADPLTAPMLQPEPELPPVKLPPPVPNSERVHPSVIGYVRGRTGTVCNDVGRVSPRALRAHGAVAA